MTFCPSCGVRQDVNLRQIHYRDLGTDASLPCPHCAIPLGVIEFDTDPAIRIERCTSCYGTFFNPGELECLLEVQTNPLVWLDPAQLQQISADFSEHQEVVYRKCPVCQEFMNRYNFGGRSGVVLDRCGQHGVWLEGSELRQLTEWWRAGGKHIHQQYEAQRTKQIFGEAAPTPRTPMAGTTEPGGLDTLEPEETWITSIKIAAVLVGLVASLFD